MIAGAVYYCGEDAFDLSLVLSHGRFSWIALHGQGREMRISRHHQHWSNSRFRTFLLKFVMITHQLILSIQKLLRLHSTLQLPFLYMLMLTQPNHINLLLIQQRDPSNSSISYKHTVK